MLDISVVICTYNGESSLPSVLNSLQKQIGTENLTWEVIVVDNNSSDRTAVIVRHFQKKWSANCPLRYTFEEKQGLAFARRCGVKECRGQLLAFLDDDNLAANNWVISAFQFGQRHPYAGAFGSKIKPIYESSPPGNFEQIACFLAIIDRGDQPFRYDILKQWLFPAGAGVVIRRQAWLDSVPERPHLTGVSGNSLASKGEDIETLSYLRQKGWQIWHNPEMQIQHHLPQYRLQPEYLFRLFKGVGLSRYPTRMLKFASWQRPPMSLAYFLNDFRKASLHYVRQRQHLNEDLVAQCQYILLLYSCFSPFYHNYLRFTDFYQSLKKTFTLDRGQGWEPTNYF